MTLVVIGTTSVAVVENGAQNPGAKVGQVDGHGEPPLALFAVAYCGSVRNCTKYHPTISFRIITIISAARVALKDWYDDKRWLKGGHLRTF